MAAINAQQIKKIYAIGNALGIVERGNDDDDLHAMVSAMTGKGSIKPCLTKKLRRSLTACSTSKVARLPGKPSGSTRSRPEASPVDSRKRRGR
jgi:hypothetical protein